MQRPRHPALEDVTNKPAKRARFPAGGQDSSISRSPTSLPANLNSTGTSDKYAITPKAGTALQPTKPSLACPPPQTPINDTLRLSHSKWGLHQQLTEGLRNCGIEYMYEWQAECLSMPGILDGEKNLVYTAPTSAGKSLGKDLRRTNVFIMYSVKM